MMVNRTTKVKKFPQGIPEQVICPHCLESFDLWDMNFTGPSGETAKAIPTRTDRLKGLPPREAKDSTGRPLHEKRCPKCKDPLPWSAGEQHDIIIGMVGARYSGKSHFVATLVHRLMNEVGRDLGSALMAVDQATINRYRDEFYRPLYENKIQLPATQPTSKPLLYTLTFGDPTKKAQNKSVSLLFYDTAGENFKDQEVVNRFVKYLSHASGLIFIVDPLQAKEVSDQITDKSVLPPHHDEGDPPQILTTVVNHLLSSGFLKTGTRLPIPVAVAFAKCDVLKKQGILPENNSVWHRDVFHDQGCYDLGIHTATQNVFEKFTDKWLDFKQNVKMRFEDAAYFGVSATGCAPNDKGQFAAINPWRVEDPLLWLLYSLGVIKGGEF